VKRLMPSTMIRTRSGGNVSAHRGSKNPASGTELRQAEIWTAEQTERVNEGRIFVAVPLFVGTARRP
jgi:hypothetical protein